MRKIRRSSGTKSSKKTRRPSGPNLATSLNESILSNVLEFFQSSHDFNGILFCLLAERLDLPATKVRKAIAKLLEEGKVTLAFYGHSGNPHVKRLPDLLVNEQLARLNSDDPEEICIYPSAQLLEEFVDLRTYDSRPFTRRLALCEPQLTPVFFELGVLERYYRDPRYEFEFRDFYGSIGLTNEHYDSDEVGERDRVFLQTFGIGYANERERVVVVYLRYLAHLSPEHQQVWNAHVVRSPCLMNSDYARVTIGGDWAEHYSVYQAFLTEQVELNKIATIIGKPNLFRKTFAEERPEGFAPMLRPTKRNFEEFVHILDKMLSENINRDFFGNDIPLALTVTRNEGTVEVQQLGTLSLLEQWLKTKYRDASGKDVSSEVLEPLRKVRKLRQNPAHVLGLDQYDRSLPAQQDVLLGSACRALTELRLILSSHPRAQDRYSAPEWLDGDKIVFY